MTRSTCTTFTTKNNENGRDAATRRNDPSVSKYATIPGPSSHCMCSVLFSFLKSSDLVPFFKSGSMTSVADYEAPVWRLPNYTPHLAWMSAPESECFCHLRESVWSLLATGLLTHLTGPGTHPGSFTWQQVIFWYIIIWRGYQAINIHIYQQTVWFIMFDNNHCTKSRVIIGLLPSSASTQLNSTSTSTLRLR